MQFKQLLLFWGVTLQALCLCGQGFLNGSFEVGIRDCGINLTNNQFNVAVPNVTAFGAQSEVDVLSANCGYDPAPDGKYFIALYFNNTSDEISMGLNEPLRAGSSYTIQFFDRLGDPVRFRQPARVQLGLSDNPADFGTLIYTAPDAGIGWNNRQVRFRAPVAGRFITARVQSTAETWVFLDNFSILCPELDLGNDTIYCKINNLSLRVGGPFERFLWSDGSTASALRVDGPGTYWVEADDGGACLLRDTIVLEEVERNCECSVYVPNAFSPNGDGINDVLLPLTPCALLDYEFLLFDRWGQPVFRSTDPGLAWPGFFRDRPVPAGSYVYALTFRFDFDDRPRRRVGTVLVTR